MIVNSTVSYRRMFPLYNTQSMGHNSPGREIHIRKAVLVQGLAFLQCHGRIPCFLLLRLSKVEPHPPQ